MKVISQIEADLFLSRISMSLDEWNRVIYNQISTPIQILPEDFKNDVYYFSCNLIDCLEPNERTYIFIDLSTVPVREEGLLFFKCIGKMATIPDVKLENLFSLSLSEFSSRGEYLSTLALLMNFFILYQWHGDFITEGARGVRITDGVVYIYQPNECRESTLENISRNKLSGVADWQLELEVDH